MSKQFKIPALLVAVLFAGQAQATLLFNQSITPDIIFGTGNTNGSFTVDRNKGVELGLRAKIPYVGTLNSGGDGTYSYSFAEQNTAISHTGVPAWNFEWTVNSDWNGSSGSELNNLTYKLGMDFDPSTATDFLVFDPVNVANADHGIGNNSTANGAGDDNASSRTAAQYANLIADNNVAQNSWRYAFFAPSFTYDPNVAGTYDVYLKAFDKNDDPVASTNIQVLIAGGGLTASVPEPSILMLFGIGLAGLSFVRRKKS